MEEPSEEAVACTETFKGKIFKNNSKLYMCVSTGSSIELNNNNIGNYVIAKDTDNVFGLSGRETHAIVSVENKKIILNANCKLMAIFCFL